MCPCLGGGVRARAKVEDKERKVAFIVICVTIFLSGFLYTYLIPLVPSYHLITGAYFSTAEVALLFASYSFGETSSPARCSFASHSARARSEWGVGGRESPKILRR